jgi:LuxR family maltose regulon positive regulatory protein
MVSKMTATAAAARGPRALRAIPGADTARGSTDAVVSRPRLIRRLQEAAGAPLALIAAPPGYGKTTLVAEWADRDPRPFAWVRLGGRGGDAAAVHGAIERARGVRGAFVLVVDDLQTLRSGPVLGALLAFARELEPGCQLALLSREVPELSLGRLRASRALVELRPGELAMTATEGAALLAKSGLDLGPAEVEMLVRKTEGWPAALHLATLELRDHADPSAAVERFGGDDAIVADYLRDEVLAGLPPDASEFLTRASVLDRLTGPLCDAVLQRGDSARVLSTLGRASCLLVSLDRKDAAYRFHGLLAEMLRAELRRCAPAEQPLLHSRASAWHAEHGDVERAVHHAVAAGDAARAAALLRARAPAYVNRRRSGTLRRWLHTFTPEQVSAHPALALAAANDHLLRGELDGVARWESAARRALAETSARRRPPALEACVALLSAALARDGVTRMGEEAARAYELEPEDSAWRPLCCLLEGVASHLTGDRDAAERRLEEGVRRAAVAAPNVQTLCLAQLALLAAERGEWEGAARFAARAMAQVERYSLAEYPTSALVFAASAHVRARRGRVAEAQDDIDRATHLIGLLTDFAPWYEVEAQVALARAAARLSDVAAARGHLTRAERRARRTRDAVVLHEWIDDARAQLGSARASAGNPASLTTAELRILTFLPTHLSFREIAGRLYVSANTVKTQAHGVYRKLDAASRSEAVARAAEMGLLD